MSEPFDLAWLNDIIIAASDGASQSESLKASGERFASASMRVGLELHEALQTASVRAAFDRACSSLTATSASSLPAFVEALPVLLEAHRFRVPNGLFDIGNILTTVYFVPRSRDSLDMKAHERMLRRLNYLLIRVQISALDKSVERNSEGFIESLAEIDAFPVPERTLLRYTETGKDLLPSPAAVFAVLGSNPLAAATTTAGFYEYVKALHAELWERAGAYQIWATPHENAKDATMVKFLWHMRIFLNDSAERLSLSVISFDRVPIVAPWYAMLVLVARAYASAVYIALTGQDVVNDVDMTTFALCAMAMGDPQEKLPHPARTLFDAKIKSMYVRSEAQDGPYWVLLRAMLSGISVNAAKAVGEKLVACMSQNDGIGPVIALMCALMRTQAGMTIFSLRVDDRGPGLAAYPFAEKASQVVDAVHEQSVFDFLMCTTSGTLDVEMLSTDDLAFTVPGRAVAAWRGGHKAADVLEPEVARTKVVNAWCAAMTAIGDSWIEAARANAPLEQRKYDKKYAVRSISLDQCHDSLSRAAASQAALHIGKWLAMVFRFAHAQEETLCRRGMPPLIRSPIDLSAPDCRSMAPDVHSDNAWLRLNFRLQAELTLHAARRGGMWTQGNHLVMVAWVVAPKSRIHEWDVGTRVFARAITRHTVDTAVPSYQEALLFSAEWKQNIERRGHDSIVDAAMQFERALQAYNEREMRVLHPQRVEISKRVAPDAKSTDDVSAPPVLPHVPRTSRDRQMAGGMAQGPTHLDPTLVGSLDDATDAALRRFRLASAEPELMESCFVCQTPFEHGVSIGVVSSPAQPAEDVKPARTAQLALQTWDTTEGQRAKLMRRLQAFQQGRVAAPPTTTTTHTE